MKKYIAPNMQVAELDKQQPLCTSSTEVDFNAGDELDQEPF